MKLATLNINSINARLPNLIKWLQLNSPDIMLLQEIKTEFNNFPFFDLQMLGYEVRILGQKGYNGVAVLSKQKLNVTTENLPNFPDENARYLEVQTTVKNTDLTIASIYLPNGNPPANNPKDTAKFDYKLKWMDAFLRHADNLLTSRKNIILGGDFNVIRTNFDVYNPEIFLHNALFLPQVRNRLNQLENSGYCDTFRRLYPQERGYTFWDYTAASFQNDLGMRIDYIFTSPALTDRLISAKVDKDFRAAEKSSDHTILIADIEDE